MHGSGILITELGNGWIVFLPMREKRDPFYHQGYGMAAGFAEKQNEDDVLKKLQEEKKHEMEFEFVLASIQRPGEFYFDSVERVSMFITAILLGSTVEGALQMSSVK